MALLVHNTPRAAPDVRRDDERASDEASGAWHLQTSDDDDETPLPWHQRLVAPCFVVFSLDVRRMIDHSWRWCKMGESSWFRWLWRHARTSSSVKVVGMHRLPYFRTTHSTTLAQGWRQCHGACALCQLIGASVCVMTSTSLCLPSMHHLTILPLIYNNNSVMLCVWCDNVCPR